MDIFSLIAVLFLMIIFILILAVISAEISYVLEEYRWPVLQTTGILRRAFTEIRQKLYEGGQMIRLRSPTE